MKNQLCYLSHLYFTSRRREVETDLARPIYYNHLYLEWNDRRWDNHYKEDFIPKDYHPTHPIPPYLILPPTFPTLDK